MFPQVGKDFMLKILIYLRGRMKSFFSWNKNIIKTVNNTFQADYYQLHNVARLKHLDQLNLDFKNKSVLEIGAGIGDHTYYLLIKGAKVTSTDARPELVEQIKNRFAVETFVLDVEKDLDKLKSLPKFDIIYCYGLLYHISNPEEFLSSLRGKAGLLLLETCVSNDLRPENNYIVDENISDPTQASSGKGCRPSRSWIEKVLKKTFNYVYYPIMQPDHSEFPKDWSIEHEDRLEVIRAIYVASENEINNKLLIEEKPVLYK